MRYSITKHGGRLLIPQSNDGFLPAFAVDLSQRVIFHEEGCPLEGEPKRGTIEISFHSDNEPRQAWEGSAGDLAGKIQTAIQEAPKGIQEALTLCYPGGRLARVNYIALPEAEELHISADDALSIIEAIRADDVDPELKDEAVDMLKGAGVLPIPSAPVFNQQYHLTMHREANLNEGTKIHEVHPGWTMKGRVLIKATVELI